MARDYKREYRLFQSSPEMLEYRAELNKINRNNPNSVKGDKKDVSHKDGGTVLEDESVNRGRSGEGGRKKGPRTRKKRANKGMVVKKSPKMYVEGGVEDVDVDETEKKGLDEGFFKRLMGLFRSKEEAPEEAPATMTPKKNYSFGNTLPAAEIITKGDKSIGTDLNMFFGFVPEAPGESRGPLASLIDRSRVERFKKRMDELGPGYREAVNAAIFKETGGAGLGKAGYNVAENMSYSTDGKRLAETFYNSFDNLGYGTGVTVPGDSIGRAPITSGYPVLDTLKIGQDYGRNPEKLGDTMYGDRGGYKYRGRGYLQLTGEPNYKAVSKDLYGDPNVLLENPDLIMENPETAQLAAMSYLDMTRKATVKNLEEQKLVSTDEVKDMTQADLNLLVVLQVSGGKLNATTVEGLKKMDEKTSVERDYDKLMSNYKTPSQWRKHKKEEKARKKKEAEEQKDNEKKPMLRNLIKKKN